MAPIDRDYISKIATFLDDIVDLINAAASRFVILSIERIDDYISKLADLMLSAVSEISKSISNLKRLKHAKEHYAKINSLEKEADETYHGALSDLFHYYREL